MRLEGKIQPLNKMFLIAINIYLIAFFCSFFFTAYALANDSHLRVSEVSDLGIQNLEIQWASLYWDGSLIKDQMQKINFVLETHLKNEIKNKNYKFSYKFLEKLDAGHDLSGIDTCNYPNKMSSNSIRLVLWPKEDLNIQTLKGILFIYCFPPELPPTQVEIIKTDLNKIEPSCSILISPEMRERLEESKSSKSKSPTEETNEGEVINLDDLLRNYKKWDSNHLDLRPENLEDFVLCEAKPKLDYLMQRVLK